MHVPHRAAVGLNVCRHVTCFGDCHMHCLLTKCFPVAEVGRLNSRLLCLLAANLLSLRVRLSPGVVPLLNQSMSGHCGGVFVTCEHVRHNKSGIAHRGRTRVNHLRELPTKFAAVGRLPCPAEPVNHRCTFGMRGAEKLGRQLVVPKSRAAFFNLEKQVIPRAALGAQNGALSYETVC
jgi:hypothetical protein